MKAKALFSIGNDAEYEMDDKELRLKCIELILENNPNIDAASTVKEADILFNYINGSSSE